MIKAIGDGFYLRPGEDKPIYRNKLTDRELLALNEAWLNLPPGETLENKWVVLPREQ